MQSHVLSLEHHMQYGLHHCRGRRTPSYAQCDVAWVLMSHDASRTRPPPPLVAQRSMLGREASGLARRVRSRARMPSGGRTCRGAYFLLGALRADSTALTSRVVTGVPAITVAVRSE